MPVATTEVRFHDLSISSTVAVGGRSLPSLTNDIINMLQVSPGSAPTAANLVVLLALQAVTHSCHATPLSGPAARAWATRAG